MRLILSHAAEGALGGLIGTALMMQGMGLAQSLPEPIKPPAMKGDPGDFMVKKVEDIAGKPLPDRTHGVLAHGLHWAYGTTWGTLLGLATPFLRSWPQAIAAGAAMGALSWSAGYIGWLPATGLTQPVHKQGAGHVATALLSHILYGIVAAIPMFAIHLATSRRARMWRRLFA